MYTEDNNAHGLQWLSADKLIETRQEEVLSRCARRGRSTSVRWRLQNLAKMDKEKRAEATERLRKALEPEESLTTRVDNVAG